ncbi:DNRLRE domain-containing protein [Chondromyces apiculatus]|uniref:Disintegrin domain-containing protein n=1 Tax=Chondromyces apiculatus DSM 436 TaxID=1192034 RepID=A0A017T583_9BACT|nr:DNRLRE domain-containing protein [Chondromyces apiculatus]EYF04394.1 Hypothetical protein CAP_4533 [Chondromyces apiculatus DSM 436]
MILRNTTMALLVSAVGLFTACTDNGDETEAAGSLADEELGEVGQRLTGPQIDAVAQKGVTWTVADTVSWVQANGCAACHRAGAPLYGASLAAHTGYDVNTSAANGTGWLAQYVAVSEQQPDGRWTHGGIYDFSKSGYNIFGLAGYTKYTSTAYLSDLRQGVDWGISASNPYTFTFGNDGLAHANTSSKYFPQDHNSFPTDSNWIIPTAQFAIAAHTLVEVDSALTPAQKTTYQNFASSLANSLEAQYVRSGNSWTTLDIAYAAIGAASTGRTPVTDPVLAQMRDVLIARHNPGQGWSDAALGGQNVLSTAEALYGLCLMGVRSDESQEVFDGIDWLAQQQCAPANNYCGTGNNHLDGGWNLPGYAADVPSIYSSIAMACYGTLNVEVSISPPSGIVQPIQPIAQTSTFTIDVTNTGYAANNYTITLGGTWAGITSLTQTNSAFSLNPNESAASQVSVTFAPNQPGSVVIPITATIAYATSSGPAQRTVTYNVNIPEQPTINATPTQTIIVSGNGAVVSPGTHANLAARVQRQNGQPVTDGTVTFYGGSAAIATVQANAQGIFVYDWLVPANAPQGFQSFSAKFGGYATNDFSVNLAESSATGSFTVGNGQGSVCTFDVDCLSGFCVDGVCCNSACGGNNANDCQVCSQAAGAATNGVCSVRAAGSVCRPSLDGCDVEEVCNGSATSCPADVVLPPAQCASGCVTVQDGLAAPHNIVADSYIAPGTPNDTSAVNYPELLTGNRPTLGDTRAILKFDLSFIGHTRTIVSSNLTLFQKYSATPNASVSVRQLLAPWTEPTGVYNTIGAAGLGGTNLGTLTNLAVGLSSGSRSVNLASIVQQWVSGDAANNGVYLDSAATRLLYSSSEDATQARRPKLEVCYYPFP